MQGYFAVLNLLLMMGMILIQVAILNRKGVQAMNFGKTDRTDFLIPPLADSNKQ